MAGGVEMPLEKVEYGDFIYIAYAREGYPAYEQLRRELDRSAGLVCGSKDVVVDLTNCPGIGSPEMASLVRLVRALQELRRTVHVVASSVILNQLTSVNLHHLPFVAIHETREEAFSFVSAHSGVKGETR